LDPVTSCSHLGLGDGPKERSKCAQVRGLNRILRDIER